MKKTYIIANVFWLVLSIAVCLQSWRLDVGGLHTPGPGFLPFYSAILLGVLALISLIQILKETEGPAAGILGGVRWFKLVFMLVSLFIYVLLFNLLGFVLATFLLLLVLFRVIEPYGWKMVLISSLLTITGTYFFFVVLLESRLPRGFLGF
jgi:putative tricarboxylic transport membrane protein